jgi:predicted tellurium resistance membrane protein TerC
LAFGSALEIALEHLFSAELVLPLLSLAALEIVLGIDNLVFLSIVTSRLPPEERPKARRLGIAFACLTRIALLMSLAWLARMTTALFSAFGQEFSLRDLILIAGGLFLLVKATLEIHNMLEGEENPDEVRPAASFWMAIAQIAVIDIVFSLDSVITAVGMVDNIPVMVAAILLAVTVMLFAANPVSNFIDRHPTVKMLALSFLILVGAAIIAEGFEQKIPKGYLYFAMAFSIGVEALNMVMRRRSQKVIDGE